MSQRNFYEHEFLEPNEVEIGLQAIESRLSLHIDNILILIEKKICSDIDSITNLIYETVEWYLIMYYRSFALIEEFQFTYDQNKTLKQNSVLEMLEKILNTKYINRLANTIRTNYKLNILECNDEFLISDQIVSTCSINVKNRFFGSSNRQIGMNNILILFPLSSSYYICFSNQTVNRIKFDSFRTKLTDENLDAINRVICNNSYNKCVAKSKSALEKAIKTYDWKSPSGYMAGGFENGGVFGVTNKKEVFYFIDDDEKWEFFTSHKWIDYKHLNRNELCKCGSGIKFKKCCLEKFNESKRMLDDIDNGDDGSKYKSSPYCEMEQPISHFDSRK